MKNVFAFYWVIRWRSLYFLTTTVTGQRVVTPKYVSSVYCGLFFDALRVVYMLQSCPMDDAVRLLNPILSAETWVRNKLQRVNVGQSVQKNWLTSVFCFCPVAPQHFWASPDLQPSDSSAALSCSPRWCRHFGGSVTDPQGQNPVWGHDTC